MMCVNTVYREPFCYEIAFSFVGVKRQVDLFERFINEYSGIEVARFVDIGCGPSLQLREIAKRGYEAVGLDLSPKMLRYLQEKAREEGVEIETVEADLLGFRLRKKVDFAFIMMGTISCADSNENFLEHLDCVADCLRRGGLYLIENFRLDWSRKDFFGSQSWTMERRGIKVTTTYDIRVKNTLEQVFTEKMILEVDDHGKKLTFQEISGTKMIFPQEFLTLVESTANSSS